MKQRWNHIRHVYFLGIGGIGMSALARYFKHLGKSVAGYDLTKTKLTEKLASEGMSIVYDESLSAPPPHFTKEDTLVIYTPAVPETHPVFSGLRNKGYAIYKRAQVLGMICNSKRCIAVAGTHGKTTVSSMLAVILKESSHGCGAFLGGILKNYHSNLILPERDDQWLVTEADEYDRSFLNLTPERVLITAIDPDHLDIYQNTRELKNAFVQFVSQVKKGGTLIVNRKVKWNHPVPREGKKRTYALHEKADYYADSIRLDKGIYRFDLGTPQGIIPEMVLHYPGLVNLENAVAASALALESGVTPEEIRKGLTCYQGVVRRFDVRFKDQNRVFIDDYAHHPKELEAVIQSVRRLYKGKRITGIFQPHLFTRTRDLAEGFARSLDLLDMAVLIPIYPAREKPMKGITSGLIIRKMKNKNALSMNKEEVIPWVLNTDWEVLLTLGAGNIDQIADRLTEELEATHG
jgi:UDP-N-acetylmuramate--alanine ligase